VGCVEDLYDQVQVVEGPVRELATTTTLHSVVHQAGGSDVFTLRETTHGLAATSTMHTKVHQADGSGVLALRETVDVLQMLDRAVAANEEAALAKKIDFATDLHVSVGRVEGDGRRLCNAVEALLASAIQNTPEQGRVLLHASGTTEGALLVVSDNGLGSKETGKENPAITAARETIKAHGGALSVMAEAGQGTLVRIDLPR
jgi:signal transduction histidine kinase